LRSGGQPAAIRPRRMASVLRTAAAVGVLSAGELLSIGGWGGGASAGGPDEVLDVADGGDNTSTAFHNNTAAISEKENEEEKEEEETTKAVYLTQGENIMLGAFAGIFKTYLLMPLATWKYCQQSGRALPKSIGEWYRGVLPNAAFMVPITIAQIWTNGVLEKIWSNNGERQLEKYEKVVVAVVAGALSALLYGPLDLVIIQQQKLKLGLIATLSHIKNEYGVMKFMRGLKACMVREAVYTGGYLGLAPVLSELLQQSGNPIFDGNPIVSAICGSIVAGVTASLVTHPVDTAKTNLQADVLGVQYLSTRQAMIELMEESGLKSLYKGGVARCTQVSAAVFTLSSLRTMAIEFKRENLGFFPGQRDKQPGGNSEGGGEVPLPNLITSRDEATARAA